MPERRGIPRVASGLPLSAENAVRELETVFDADAEPGHAVGTQDAENRAEQDYNDLAQSLVLQAHEVVGHAGGDQQPQYGEEFALSEQVRLAGLPNGVGNLGHALMHREGFGLLVLHQPESGANETDHEAQIHQRCTAHAPQPVELHRIQWWNMMSASPA